MAEDAPEGFPEAPSSAARRGARSAEEGDPDRGLLERVAAGDGAAFEAFVERHQERLLRLCHRYLGNRAEAEEAAQEVFLKIYRKAGRFEPRGRVSTWLYRIAVNHCLNQLRRRKVVRFLSLGGGDEGDGADPGDAAAHLEPVDPGADPADALEARRRWAATRKALDALPESQRSVVLLTRFEGLSYRETAEVLGVTVGAVESRLFRAMRSLEAALPELAGGAP